MALDELHLQFLYGVIGTGAVIGSSEIGSSRKCELVVPNMLIHSSALKSGRSSTFEPTVMN